MERLGVRSVHDASSIENRDGAVVAQTAAAAYHGFGGLGLRCVIVRGLPGADEVSAALAKALDGSDRAVA